ncbi:MAG: peptidase [Candidatus Taylorbacteria bacterium]|nr:peptidase [Candidatus Taylorbacteria bacterium]
MEINFYFQIAVIIVSIIFHELAHGYTAYFLGDPTAKYEGRLTLNPLKHLEIFGSILVPIITYALGGVVFGWAKPVPYNPYNIKNKYGEVMVAVAGPISNFLVAFVFALYFRTLDAAGMIAPNGQLALLIIMVNITLGVFNMIPIPPLDGFKVFTGLLPYNFRYIKEYIEKNILLFIVIFIFGFSFVMDPIVAWLFRLMTGIGGGI